MGRFSDLLSLSLLALFYKCNKNFTFFILTYEIKHDILITDKKIEKRVENV